jgi:hypothetical protein
MRTFVKSIRPKNTQRLGRASGVGFEFEAMGLASGGRVLLALHDDICPTSPYSLAKPARLCLCAFDDKQASCRFGSSRVRRLPRLRHSPLLFSGHQSWSSQGFASGCPIGRSHLSARSVGQGPIPGLACSVASASGGANRVVASHTRAVLFQSFRFPRFSHSRPARPLLIHLPFVSYLK